MNISSLLVGSMAGVNGSDKLKRIGRSRSGANSNKLTLGKVGVLAVAGLVTLAQRGPAPIRWVTISG